MRENHSVSEMCEALEASRSGYYRWRSREAGEREPENERLCGEIEAIHGDRHMRVYGSPRMTVELNARGHACSENRVARLMKQEGIRPLGKRPFKPKTTQPDPEGRFAPNLLAEASAPEPGNACGSDITCVATREGWLYLAVVIDPGSRIVLGWQIGESLATELVLGAIDRSLECRNLSGLLPEGGDPVIFHSDRGCQYSSDACRRRLRELGMTQSMSATGCCYDNATCESFFATLKAESFPEDCVFDTKRHARRAIFDYLETFYNSRRRHSSLGYLSPEAYARKHFQSLKQHLN
jgi:putative transposase